MKYILSLCCSLFFTLTIVAQNVTITPGGITPAQNSTIPRISYDAILALPSPQNGDQAYDVTFQCMRVYTAGKWLCSYQDPSNYAANITAFASAGGNAQDYGTDIATDNSGNIYITGFYNQTATFGSITKTAVGSNDIFIVKYNKSGVVQWVRSAGGTSIDYARSIAVDAGGNVYITGTYNGQATFESTTITASGGSNSDIFIAKYNTNGVFQWVRSAGGAEEDTGFGIALDANSNVYVTGRYRGTAIFGVLATTAAGEADIFVAKYASNGSFYWVVSAGGAYEDIGYSIAADAAGTVSVTGYYIVSATFETTTKTSAGGGDIFVARYNTNGALVWVQSAGGSAFDQGQGITVDASGNAYVTGLYTGSASFWLFSKTSQGSNDAFVAKYNTNGEVAWVQSAGGESSDVGNDVTIDGSGNVYIAGSFRNTSTFGSILKSAEGGIDIFVAKYSNNGRIFWVQAMGSSGNDDGRAVAIDSNGNGYATGGYSGTVTFGRINKTSQGLEDAFVLRFDK
ncbi:SBBP repeat-containing protein [Emticicia sp. C21]|uniref:SBBP repeat-containing protein n=1 Tax=Emticicia sp. C21 TaxID=2302915 RepID=UPI000E3502BF|nr:SBBP repeat-containing protein [Emticicia sp. C21]RFS17015.1 hypothetical protein D0T08_10075 [Emticicia sp. C21]